TTHARSLWEKPRLSWIEGSVTFTIVTSRTIISIPAQSTYRAAQRARSSVVVVVMNGASRATSELIGPRTVSDSPRDVLDRCEVDTLLCVSSTPTRTYGDQCGIS